ncbi:MAG TPA: LysR family transcriptional regulator [Kiloniellales bacterium]|nr:LysR family transcriptional regulator [Kiloniellales bacterium]
MDVELAKTFLEIVNTGSFVRAAERLNVTQTTVSARVRSLESRLGRKLFVRNKAGASLTAAGEQFLGYAPTFVQLWQRACQQVAIPAGRRALLTVGAELSLWNPLLLNWMLRMRDAAPDIALRTDVSIADELMRQVAGGILDIAIMYRPQKLPGLRIEELLQEKLVLVTTNDRRPKSSDYVYVDWGPRFVARHDMSFPDLAHPGVGVNLGPLGLSYIVNCGGSGYFRMRTARPYLKAGRLRLVRGAPEYSYPVHAVYPIDGDADRLEPALVALRAVAASEADEWPIEAKPTSIQAGETPGGRGAPRSRKLRRDGSLAAAGPRKRR